MLSSFHLNNGCARVYIGPYKPSGFKNNIPLFSKLFKPNVMQNRIKCKTLKKQRVDAKHVYYLTWPDDESPLCDLIWEFHV